MQPAHHDALCVRAVPAVGGGGTIRANATSASALTMRATAPQRLRRRLRRRLLGKGVLHRPIAARQGLA